MLDEISVPLDDVPEDSSELELEELSDDVKLDSDIVVAVLVEAASVCRAGSASVARHWRLGAGSSAPFSMVPSSRTSPS